MTLKEKVENQKRKVALNTRVPKNILVLADSIAEITDVSRSDVVREALERCLPIMRKEVN